MDNLSNFGIGISFTVIGDMVSDRNLLHAMQVFFLDE